MNEQESFTGLDRHFSDADIKVTILDDGAVSFFDRSDGWAAIAISHDTMQELIKRWSERF